MTKITEIKPTYLPGAKLWQIYSEPSHIKCPMCEGKKIVKINGISEKCPHCRGWGQIGAVIYKVRKTEVESVNIEVWSTSMTIKYRLTCGALYEDISNGKRRWFNEYDKTQTFFTKKDALKKACELMKKL